MLRGSEQHAGANRWQTNNIRCMSMWCYFALQPHIMPSAAFLLNLVPYRPANPHNKRAAPKRTTVPVMKSQWFSLSPFSHGPPARVCAGACADARPPAERRCSIQVAPAHTKSSPRQQRRGDTRTVRGARRGGFG